MYSTKASTLYPFEEFCCVYLCNHINMAKSSTVGFNLRNKEGISEEMVQHSHDMFMD